MPVPCSAASDLAAEQEQAYQRCILPLESSIDDLDKTAALLTAVLRGKLADALDNLAIENEYFHSDALKNAVEGQ